MKGPTILEVIGIVSSMNVAKIFLNSKVGYLPRQDKNEFRTNTACNDGD